MNLTISTSKATLTIQDQNTVEQLKKSFFTLDEKGNINTIQVYLMKKLCSINSIDSKNKSQIEDQTKLLKFFDVLENEEIFVCANVRIECIEDKAIRYLCTFTNAIKEGRQKEDAMKIAQYYIYEGFSIEKYFNKPCDFSPMFNKEGYEYFTYSSQKFSHDKLNLMDIFEEFLLDEVYLRYEIVKYPSSSPQHADWDYCFVIHAITKEQKEELIDFEKLISNA